MGRRWSAEEDPAQSRLAPSFPPLPTSLIGGASTFLLLAGCPKTLPSCPQQSLGGLWGSRAGAVFPPPPPQARELILLISFIQFCRSGGYCQKTVLICIIFF